jgi:hypothetical protein
LSICDLTPSDLIAIHRSIAAIVLALLSFPSDPRPDSFGRFTRNIIRSLLLFVEGEVPIF